MKEGHLEQFSIGVCGVGGEGGRVGVEYECEQCFGVTEVELEVRELFSYVVGCGHCGLRTVISVSHIV